MALTTRVFGAGKLLVLIAALIGTYFLFFAAAMRVANRSREVVVPNLIGRSVNEVTTALNELGLTVRVEEGRRPDPKIPAGQVVLQEPAAGSTTRRPRGVKVWLSAGPSASIVPNLVGESERTAQIRLQTVGLKLTGLAEIRSSEYPPDTVVAQWPAPDSRAPGVTLLVNRGEQGRGYVMPDLIGVNGDRAADVLRQRGFRVAVVGKHPYPGIPPGVVIRQNPQAGFQITPGEAISLEVSQ